MGRRGRVDDLPLAFVAVKEVVNDHARLRGPEMTAHWAVYQHNKKLGQELTADVEGTHGGWIRAARDRKLGVRKKFKVPEQVRIGEPSKALVDTLRAFTWKMVDGKRDVRARVVAKGHQGPDLMAGAVATLGCVGLRPSRL